MAKLGPITGTITLTFDGTSVPVEVASFEVPLRTSTDIKRGDTAATVEVKVDRTALRENLTATLREIADHIEGDFDGSPDGMVVLTCQECGAQVGTQTVATLRHESDGSHVLDPA